MNVRFLNYCLVFTVLVMSGCSKVVIKSDSDPGVNLAELETFYVRKFPPDERGIEKKIASKLNELGFVATSGVSQNPTGPVDAVVSYEDRWMWDITMYMLEIDIKLHDPETDFIFASGSSYRTSLVRESPEEMIEEVFRDMFSGKVDLPEKTVGEEKIPKGD
jgi:hypothetical protein